MSSIELRQPSDKADKQLVRQIFFTVPMVERGKPIIAELTWFLLDCQDSKAHANILPDYCYNIFEVFRRTLFKGFPKLKDTVQIIDPAGVPTAKTLEEVKKVIRIDWKNIGRGFGIMARCIRFAEYESEEEINRDEVGEPTPQENEDTFRIICGAQWVAQNQMLIKNEPFERVIQKLLLEHVASALKPLENLKMDFNGLAFQWSPAAMTELHEGFAEGFNSFIDEVSQLAGESPRTGIYGFLLLVWPEIKAMLESNPRKTLTDLHGCNPSCAVACSPIWILIRCAMCAPRRPAVSV